MIINLRIRPFHSLYFGLKNRAWNGIGNCGLAESRGFVNWRDMFINRPRLLYDGCYISKTSYSRPGENSFQDADYQPWHLVTYFRYLRFFADGTALMLTTADAPSTMLAHLKRKNGRHPALIRGIYSFHDTFVRVVFKRKNAAASKAPAQRHRKKRDTNNNDSCTVCEQTFELVGHLFSGSKLIIIWTVFSLNLFPLDWFVLY